LLHFNIGATTMPGADSRFGTLRSLALVNQDLAKSLPTSQAHRRSCDEVMPVS